MGRKKSRTRQDVKSATKARQHNAPPQGSKKQAEKKQKQKEQEQKQQQQSPPYEMLVGQAEVAFEEMKFQECIQLCDQALEIMPDDIPSIELKALAYLQLEEPEQARVLFEQAVEIEPDQGASKYLYLGQMSYAEEAAAFLGKGIELLAGELEEMADSAEPEEIQALQDQIATAFCSLAEVYLTDLCEVDEAQDMCLSLMQKALEYDDCNVQALQTLASIHISLSEPEKAKEYLHRSLDLWWGFMRRQHQKMDTDGEGDGSSKMDLKADDEAKDEGATADDDEEEDDDEVKELIDPDAEDEDVEDEITQLPPYEARINAAKMLIELEEYPLALELLDLLIAEDDSIMQVWYLQGWTQHLQGDGEGASQSLLKAKQTYLASQADRPEVLAHIEELLASVPASE
eukprot:m.50623 g.50623  ORF g.50623 m.50623 type:complete len:402 (+) comp12561_c0_seq7:1471-2676(+)